MSGLLLKACIDDNFKIVKFLVEHGSDINARDNEGWTALHATSSCGFLDIARSVSICGFWSVQVNSATVMSSRVHV